MKTADEVLELLEQKYSDSYIGYKNETVNFTTSVKARIKDEGKVDEEINGVRIKEVERFGGVEGAGEEHWVVISVKDGKDEQFFKIPGWYQSYNGAELEFENIYEVKPAEKTVTVWKRA